MKRPLLVRRPSSTLSTSDRVARAIEHLEGILAEQDRLIELLMAQTAENNLRIRYVMETMTYTKPSLLIGGATKKKTLYEIYMDGDRARFLRDMEKADASRLQASGQRAAEEPPAPGPQPGDGRSVADGASLEGTIGDIERIAEAPRLARHP